MPGAPISIATSGAREIAVERGVLRHDERASGLLGAGRRHAQGCGRQAASRQQRAAQPCAKTSDSRSAPLPRPCRTAPGVAAGYARPITGDNPNIRSLRTSRGPGSITSPAPRPSPAAPTPGRRHHQQDRRHQHAAPPPAGSSGRRGRRPPARVGAVPRGRLGPGRPACARAARRGGAPARGRPHSAATSGWGRRPAIAASASLSGTPSSISRADAPPLRGQRARGPRAHLRQRRGQRRPRPSTVTRSRSSIPGSARRTARARSAARRTSHRSGARKPAHGTRDPHDQPEPSRRDHRGQPRRAAPPAAAAASLAAMHLARAEPARACPRRRSGARGRAAAAGPAPPGGR